MFLVTQTEEGKGKDLKAEYGKFNGTLLLEWFFVCRAVEVPQMK